MLRQKHTLRLTIYNLRRNIPFLSNRNVHVSHSFSLRKIPVEVRKSTEFQAFTNDQCIDGEFQPRKETNTNFYGIEGDEGVTNCEIGSGVSSLAYDSFLNKLAKTSVKEKFKNTRFGAIRYDAPNKPLFHGQYEKSESKFDATLQTDMFRKTRKLRSFVIENDDRSTNQGSVEKFRLEQNIESRGIDEQYFNPEILEKQNIHENVPTENTEKFMQEPNYKISVIDEQYFNPELLEGNITDNCPDAKLPSASDNLNFIDESYFSNKSKNNNAVVEDDRLNPIKLSTDIREKFNHEILESEDDINIIDGQYFPEKILHGKNINFERSLSDNEPTNKNYLSDKNNEVNFKVDHINANTEKNASNVYSSESLKDENIGFIDELFFNNELENQGRDNSVKNTNLHQVETVSENSMEKFYSSNFNENFVTNKSNLKQEKIDKVTSNTVDRIVQKSKMGATNFENNFIQDSISDRNSISVTERLNKGTAHSHKSKLAAKKLQSLFQEAGNSMRTVNIPLKSAGNRKSLAKSSPQTESKSSVVNQELSQQTDVAKINQVETAYDFAKKLRSEKKITHSELRDGRYIQKEEKLDYKGFRILKNQVPNLMHYTRNEIVDLLVKNVLYSDSDIVVLNKPYSLVMHESKTTENSCCLSQYLDDVAAELDRTTRNPKLITVHRLDKETTGCLLLARNETASLRLNSLFAQRKISKTYWIVTTRVPDPLEGVIDIPISEGSIQGKTRMVLQPKLSKDIPYANHSKGGKRAVTHYKVVAESGNAALVEVSPETGIKHQIRVHFGFGLSCPILGDHKYSYTDKLVPQKLATDLLQRLHVRQSKVRHIPMHIYARSILIPQYSEGRNLFVTAPMPIHMSKNLQSLQFKKSK